ncbi:hypothetical protein [Micromonospora cathayae]|uniref:AAA+ ATPase domain-containing protein n=1 Tax=Micromonospora cathayae TaxID=3028804 RepID=A0ABY7ZV54_9ACTN|nr:hypothetical protein [Micromonospora sp. HUAS 3]WDZ86930.1 hypothetical protein PVK37_11280 [Micromonospora sp. HUAS 3]
MTGVLNSTHEPAERIPTNPFAVPGLMRPVAPLNPVRNDRHVAFYVPVDNTETAFQQFKAEFGEPSYLADTGRLVVVTGDKSCGKTALINRCAHWLRERLVPVGLHGEVIDLTREARDNQTMAERRARVCAALVDQLYERRLLVSELVREMRSEPDDVYRNLAGCLVAGLVPIVLLPPSADLTEELVDYANYARRRIVFVGETSDGLSEERRQRVDQAGEAGAVHLAVSRLGTHDASRFAEERLRTVPEGVLPRVAPAALDQFTATRQRVSIGEVQRLLYGMYEELRVKSDRPDEVTYQHILEYFIRIAILLEQP